GESQSGWKKSDWGNRVRCDTVTASLTATIFHRRRRKIMTLHSLIPSKTRTGIAAIIFVAMATPLPAVADPFFFSTGNTDGKIATATRPDTGAPFEIETGDDFGLTSQTLIAGATFTGLLTGRNTTRSDLCQGSGRTYQS